MKWSGCRAEPDICHAQPDMRGSMTENCQQSLRQFVGSTYWPWWWVVKERESTEQRCHRWWLVRPAGWGLCSTEIIQTYRLQLMSQSQTNPPRHRTTNYNTAIPVTPSFSPAVLVELLANYSNLTTGWTLHKHWTPPDCTSQQQQTSRGR